MKIHNTHQIRTCVCMCVWVFHCKNAQTMHASYFHTLSLKRIKHARPQSNLTTSFIALLWIIQCSLFCACVLCRTPIMQRLFNFFSSQEKTQEVRDRDTLLIEMLFIISHSKMGIHQIVILTTIHIFGSVEKKKLFYHCWFVILCTPS